MPEFPDIEQEGEVLTESETRLEKPKSFKVLLHNDDFTTMEFVIFVLQYVFNRSDAERAFALSTPLAWQFGLDANFGEGEPVALPGEPDISYGWMSLCLLECARDGERQLCCLTTSLVSHP